MAWQMSYTSVPLFRMCPRLWHRDEVTDCQLYRLRYMVYSPAQIERHGLMPGEPLACIWVGDGGYTDVVCAYRYVNHHVECKIAIQKGLHMDDAVKTCEAAVHQFLRDEGLAVLVDRYDWNITEEG